MKPTVRVTQIEQFRRWMSGKYEFMTEQDVIDSITHEFSGNEYTQIGTAFHGIVENGDNGMAVPQGDRCYRYYNEVKIEAVPEGKAYAVDGAEVVFDASQVKVALDYRAQFADAFHEQREFKDYGDAIVTGCADLIHGATIRDIKTKYSPVNDSDYTDSCQWRFYMELFGVETFYFDLFIFEGYKKERHGVDVRGLELKRYEPAIECLHYPRLEEDCRRLLDEFLEWANFRGLTQFLQYKKNG